MIQHAKDSPGEIFKDPQGEVRLEVRLERETVWLSLDQMTKLFRRNKALFPAFTPICLRGESLNQLLHKLQQFNCELFPKRKGFDGEPFYIERRLGN